MLVGVPKEIKDKEFRVGVIPATAQELALRGHTVLVETGAGSGAGLSDESYAAAGAEIVGEAAEIFERAELIVKVKEPLAAERRKLRRGQVIFTYLHLAADRVQDQLVLLGFRGADRYSEPGANRVAYDDRPGYGRRAN